MRFFKPLLAAAAVLSIAAPAASALADPYWGGHDDQGYGRDYGFGRDYGYDHDRYDWGREHYWRERERERAAWRHHMWRERHEYRGYGWRY